MASLVKHVVPSTRVLIKNVSSPNAFTGQIFLSPKIVRCLYSDNHLGLDKYREQRTKVTTQFTGLKEKFCNRMKSYVKQEGQTMIFTEDLKNMMYLAGDSPEDIELSLQMIQKFHKQNKELRFGTFIFGPVVLRWLHFMDKPDLTFQLMTNEELSGFFDQVSSFHIAMDHLFKHKRYEDVLCLFQLLQEKNFQGSAYHRDPVVLALGSCYYLNTPESFAKAISLIQGARSAGQTIIRRALTFAAALALKQGDPKIAMEVLSLTPYSSYITVRNIRLQVLAEMDRVDDIFPILRQVVDRDVPRQNKVYKDICQETLDIIQKKVDEMKDKETSHIFEQICRALKENNHITEETVAQLLSEPIAARVWGDKEISYHQGSTSRPSRSYNAYRGESHNWSQSQYRQRNGIRDMDE